MAPPPFPQKMVLQLPYGPVTGTSLVYMGLLEPIGHLVRGFLLVALFLTP